MDDPITSSHMCSMYYLCSVAQSYPTFYDPRVCSPPGSSVHGIFQARILEWVAISSSTGSSQHKTLLWLLHWQVDSLALCHLGSQFPHPLPSWCIYWSKKCESLVSFVQDLMTNPMSLNISSPEQNPRLVHFSTTHPTSQLWAKPWTI